MSHIWKCEKCGCKTSSDRCPDCAHEKYKREFLKPPKHLPPTPDEKGGEG